MKLWGLLLFLWGDLSLIFYLNESSRQPIIALEETLPFLTNLHWDVNEWKIPLEEAIQRQQNTGRYIAKLQEIFQEQKERLGIRNALLSGVEKVLPLNTDIKELLAHYFSQLGKLKKEPLEEVYQRVRIALEEHLAQEKNRYQSRRKVTAGCVGCAGCVAAILLL